MTRYAIGDLQGCHTQLQALLAELRFAPDRDQLWLVGDLVNRGPDSLHVLRFVRALGDNAVVVLGNHDLHLLAVAYGARHPRKSDTLDEILSAPDRDVLLEWLLTRPLAHVDESARLLMVHAGVVPQWTVEMTRALAAEVEAALRNDPHGLFANMYGDEPDQWSDSLQGMDRIRFTINVLTRLRVCTPEGRVDLKMKGKPPKHSPLQPWFQIEQRRSTTARIIFGHWSALGLVVRPDVVGLDSGCVWGGALTAFDLDTPREPVSVACQGYLAPGEE